MDLMLTSAAGDATQDYLGAGSGHACSGPRSPASLKLFPGARYAAPIRKLLAEATHISDQSSIDFGWRRGDADRQLDGEAAR
jgi:hypothetical protein